ncbi:MAG: tetratricopeptide repeat protein, partial [Nannocystaceae bacterium]|nr:tetratricopeptide repeat protein [Nannocystaceae bacterium]
GGDAQLADTWTPALHTQAHEAFLKTELPYAQRAWDRNGTRLEIYAKDWVSTYTDACQATTVRRAQSEAAMDLRMACLHRARTALGATVSLLTSADAGIVARAGSMLDALPSLPRCSDLSALDANLDPPSTAQAPAVENIRVVLARAKTRRLAGRYAAARRGLDAVQATLNQTGYEPVRTEFLLEDALLAELESRYVQAAEKFHEAIQLGSKWGQWDEVRLAARMAIFVAARQGEFDESMAIVSISRGLAEASSDPADVAEVHATLGAALLLHGRAIDAEGELRTALKGLALVKGRSNRRVARVRANLAAALVGQGRHKEAIAQFNEQIAVMTDLLGPAHPDIARTRQTLGNAQHRLGHLDAAEREHLAALHGRELAFGADHPEVADSLASLSAVHIDQGRYAQAEREARTALAISERHHGRGNRASLVPASHLARILSDQSNYDAAKLAYAQVIADTIKAFGKDGVAVALQRGALGHTLQQAGELQAAEAELRAALRVRLVKLGPAHRQTVENRLALARCLFDQAQRREAYRLYQKTLAALESTDVAVSADLGTTLSRYGAALLDGGRLEEAVEHLERSVSVFEALPDEAPRAPDAYFSLAHARLARGDPRPEVLAPAGRARASLRALGPAGVKRLAVVDAWIEAHPADGG